MRFSRSRKDKEELDEEGTGGEENSAGESGEETPGGEAEHPAVAPTGEGGQQRDPGEDEKADFFDMSPEEAVNYRPPGVLVARRKPLELKPALKTLGAVAVLGVVILGIIIIWPSSKTRVPDVSGKGLSEAMDQTRGAGLEPRVVEWKYSGEQDDGVVLSQEPNGNRVAKKGSVVSLTVSKGMKPDTGGSSLHKSVPAKEEQGDEKNTSSATSPLDGKTVCIDPGHQSAPADEEWTDPGMSRKNPGDDGGRGIMTGNPEHLVTLDIGFKLRSLLEKDGIEVLMTRESGDVELSNINRAEMANNAEVGLFVRLHCGNSSDTGKSGSLTLYPADTEWTGGIYEASKTAALYIQEELVKSCSTKDLGVFGVPDSSGFNWSKVPVVEAEVAFLSNVEEDELLATDEFRWKVAWGVRNGIIKYFESP